MFLLSPFSGARQPARAARRRAHRLPAPALLAEPPQGGRLDAFNKQLPDTITLIANALRAGSSFLQAIELVVRESRPPISTEFGRVIREVNLGLPFDQALENMVRRVRSERPRADGHRDLHPAPGRLATRRDPRLDRIHIRERVRIKGEIKTLTAQQRLSGYVVGMLPIGLAGFLLHRGTRVSWTRCSTNPPGIAACRPA
jgi:tight adherence protein B